MVILTQKMLWYADRDDDLNIKQSHSHALAGALEPSQSAPSKYFLDLCIAGQCNTNINPKNYVKLESEKYSSQKKRKMGFIESEKYSLSLNNLRNTVYKKDYSWPSLVWPNTEELISRPFLDENVTRNKYLWTKVTNLTIHINGNHGVLLKL